MIYILIVLGYLVLSIPFFDFACELADWLIFANGYPVPENFFIVGVFAYALVGLPNKVREEIFKRAQEKGVEQTKSYQKKMIFVLSAVLIALLISPFDSACVGTMRNI